MCCVEGEFTFFGGRRSGGVSILFKVVAAMTAEEDGEAGLYFWVLMDSWSLLRRQLLMVLVEDFVVCGGGRFIRG